MRLITILLFLISFCQIEKRDKFHFPQEFDKVNFTTTTVDTILTHFGRKCIIDTIYQPGLPETHNTYGDPRAEIRMTYESGNLLFFLHSVDDIHDRNWKSQLHLITMNDRSSIRFGKNPIKISNYTESAFVSLYGEPNKKIERRYIYHVSDIKKYHFTFVDSKLKEIAINW